jgi:hypothetical protein
LKAQLEFERALGDGNDDVRMSGRAENMNYEINNKNAHLDSAETTLVFATPGQGFGTAMSFQGSFYTPYVRK